MSRAAGENERERQGGARVRVAVVGCGYIAQAEHIPCLLVAKGCELAAIVEPRPRTRAVLAERLGVPGFATMAELLSDGPEFDAVDICATPMAHAPLVEAAAAAGKDILVEKPLCHSPSEARAIVETVERHGIRLMVGYMRRFDDIVLEAKRLLDSGSIGRLKSITTVFKLALPAQFHRVVDLDPEAPASAASGAGPPLTGGEPPASGGEPPVAGRPNDLLPDDEIMEQSVHHLNLVRFLGGEVREVAGAHLAPGNCHVLMLLDNGVVVNHAHMGNAGHGEEFRLYGEEGMVHAKLGSPHFPYRFPELTWFSRAEGEEKRRLFPVASPYQQEIEAFAALVRDGAPNQSTAADALRDLEVIARIHDASRRAPTNSRPESTP